MADDRHGPIEQRFRDQMNGAMRAIDEAMNPGLKGGAREVGLVLLVFPFGDSEGKWTNYISNGASRADMAVLFREMAARFEGAAGGEGHA